MSIVGRSQRPPASPVAGDLVVVRWESPSQPTFCLCLGSNDDGIYFLEDGHGPFWMFTHGTVMNAGSTLLTVVAPLEGTVG